MNWPMCIGVDRRRERLVVLHHRIGVLEPGDLVKRAGSRAHHVVAGDQDRAFRPLDLAPELVGLGRHPVEVGTGAVLGLSSHT